LDLCVKRQPGGRGVYLSGGRVVLSGEILMSTQGFLQIALYVVVLIALAKPLGSYMARVYQD